jgi:hypothetical protein
MNKQDTELARHPGATPSSPITWPAPRHVSNQVQQVKGSAKPQTVNVRPTTQPNQASVAPRTTPKNVSHVRVVTRPPVAGQKTVTVQFNHPGGDPYFAGANVYLKRAGGEPTLVAGGARSPLTFTVPVHDAPHAVFVTSMGNWGETNILTSPSHHVRLK